MPSDVGADAASPGGASDAVTRWQLPFWALQVLELGVAFLLVTQSVHVSRGGLLVAGGAALFVLALTADGPLGVFRVCGRRLHRVLVMALAVALAAACALAALRPDVEGLLVIGAAVVALLVLASRTTVAGGGGRRRGRRAGRGEVIDTTATVTSPPGTPTTDPVDALDPAADSTARKAGRTTAAAATAGRRAVDERRPQVEDGVKRTIRGAGRLAGKLASPKPPPDATDRS